MRKEVEMDFDTDYVVPLPNGRKIIAAREDKYEDKNGRMGIGLNLVDKNGDIYDLALAKVEPEHKEDIVCLRMWGDIFSEDPTDKRSIDRHGLEFLEKDNAS